LELTEQYWQWVNKPESFVGEYEDIGLKFVVSKKTAFWIFQTLNNYREELFSINCEVLEKEDNILRFVMPSSMKSTDRLKTYNEIFLDSCKVVEECYSDLNRIFQERDNDSILSFAIQTELIISGKPEHIKSFISRMCFYMNKDINDIGKSVLTGLYEYDNEYFKNIAETYLTEEEIILCNETK